MDTTRYIESLIKERYSSVKEFSNQIDVPYTTIRSAFQKGIEGTAISTVLKICKELNLSADLLFNNNIDIFYTSSEEQKIIQDLRRLPPRELDKIIGMIEMKLYEIYGSKKNMEAAEEYSICKI